ncbi:uncharacterized protein F4807DRAFT_443254 [Annulohypoxylon truncatum]|uniref:uncharacterized protein n=1 Tax=Annulohypoxylon truncatum TaxID=327061 RepID=UPI0020072842|nr:uncharacterized protein F4807DRAFT_443254 [Annulohypoxylon truncatum]KAI1205421.1 hypothetical protein F4807DRAFT_443254 [Annulohypoxylon truncatum]
MNIPDPALNPPHKKEFLRLMGDSWKAKTGVAFQDISIYDNGGITLPYTSHETPFVTLSQWNGLVQTPNAPIPTIEPPPRPIDFNKVTIEVNVDCE